MRIHSIRKKSYGLCVLFLTLFLTYCASDNPVSVPSTPTKQALQTALEKLRAAVQGEARPSEVQANIAVHTGLDMQQKEKIDTILKNIEDEKVTDKDKEAYDSFTPEEETYFLSQTDLIKEPSTPPVSIADSLEVAVKEAIDEGEEEAVEEYIKGGAPISEVDRTALVDKDSKTSDKIKELLTNPVTMFILQIREDGRPDQPDLDTAYHPLNKAQRAAVETLSAVATFGADQKKIYDGTATTGAFANVLNAGTKEQQQIYFRAITTLIKDPLKPILTPSGKAIVTAGRPAQNDLDTAYHVLNKAQRAAVETLSAVATFGADQKKMYDGEVIAGTFADVQNAGTKEQQQIYFRAITTLIKDPLKPILTPSGKPIVTAGRPTTVKEAQDAYDALNKAQRDAVETLSAVATFGADQKKMYDGTATTGAFADVRNAGTKEQQQIYFRAITTLIKDAVISITKFIPPAKPFTLTSNDFTNGGVIPDTAGATDGMGGFCTAKSDARNLSPHLGWSNAPAGTTHLIVLMKDTHQRGVNFPHWVIWDIPTTTTSLPAGVGTDRTHFPNQDGNTANQYFGPCPPSADGAHTYEFTIYAFDKDVAGLGITTLTYAGIKTALSGSASGNILGTATLTGTFDTSAVVVPPPVVNPPVVSTLQQFIRDIRGLRRPDLPTAQAAYDALTPDQISEVDAIASIEYSSGSEDFSEANMNTYKGWGSDENNNQRVYFRAITPIIPIGSNPKVVIDKSFRLVSNDFTDGRVIPARAGATDGLGGVCTIAKSGASNLSPHLKWVSAPSGTTHLIVLMKDTHRNGLNFAHWVVWDIPYTSNTLGELPAGVGTGSPSLPAGASQSGHTNNQYFGPCPPSTDGAHTYEFTVYALDKNLAGLGVGGTPTYAGIKTALGIAGSSIKGRATLTGTFRIVALTAAQGFEKAIEDAGRPKQYEADIAFYKLDDPKKQAVNTLNDKITGNGGVAVSEDKTTHDGFDENQKIYFRAIADLITDSLTPVITISGSLETGLMKVVRDAFRLRDGAGYAEAVRGYAEGVRAYLAAGADTNDTDAQGKTPLHWAAQGAEVPIVEALLEDKDINPNIQMTGGGNRYKGNTPLHWAVTGSNTDAVVQIIHLLLRHDGTIRTNPNILDTAISTRTPLGVASSRRMNIKIIKALLQYSEVDPNIKAGSRTENAPLHDAANKGYLDIVKALLENSRIEVDILDKQGFTPLHKAAQSGHLAVVKALVEAGADITIKTPTSGTVSISEKTALQLATNAEVVAFLTQYNVVQGFQNDIQVEGRPTQVQVNFANADTGLTQNKRDAITTLETAINTAGGTPTDEHASTYRGFSKSQKILFRAQTDLILVATAAKVSPEADLKAVLKALIQADDADTLKAYLYEGLNPNKRYAGELDPTLLHWAAKAGKNKVVKALLSDIRTNVNMKQSASTQKAPLHWASERGHLSVVKALLEDSRTDIDIQNNQGYTPLLLAVKYKHLDLVKAFVRAGASRTIKTKSGIGGEANKNALELARYRQRDALSDGRSQQALAIEAQFKAIADWLENYDQAQDFTAQIQDEGRPTQIQMNVAADLLDSTNPITQLETAIKTVVDNGGTPTSDHASIYKAFTRSQKIYFRGRTDLISGGKLLVDDLGDVLKEDIIQADDDVNLKAYLDEGLDPNKKYGGDQTLLHWAVGGDYPKVMQVLVKLPESIQILRTVLGKFPCSRLLLTTRLT